jgi:hypothetical protein
VAFARFPECPSSSEQSNGEYGHDKSAQGHYDFAVALCAGELRKRVQDSSKTAGAALTGGRFICSGYAATRSGPGHRLTFLRLPGVNRQGQAHIVSTAVWLPPSCKAGREIEATPWFRTWFSIDPHPASINPTINISIVFICAFLVDCGRILCHPAIENDSSATL